MVSLREMEANYVPSDADPDPESESESDSDSDDDPHPESESESDSDDECGLSSQNLALSLAPNDRGKGKLVNYDRKQESGKVKFQDPSWTLAFRTGSIIEFDQGKGKSVTDGNFSENIWESDEKSVSEYLDYLWRRKRHTAEVSLNMRWRKERKESHRRTAKRVASELAVFDASAKKSGTSSTSIEASRVREVDNSLTDGSTSKEKEPVSITWIPSKRRSRRISNVPSLLELSMKMLAKHVNTLTSLEGVPETLRHRLCHLLCDSRAMNTGFFQLLLHGTPTEIRIKDCSWLTEKDFTNFFGACDTTNLSVLQLDQCSRCVNNNVLVTSVHSMPALCTLSLRGASGVTDIGLISLFVAAPSLRSINLSQCSLLTSTGIDTLGQAYKSQLLELYIDDCQMVDAIRILPALNLLDHLEVLSLDGIDSVSDYFVREFVSVHGHNMKELVLANCMNLTDSSVKVIAETCPSLCALDLMNLSKLTDATLEYLAEGCLKIRTLKLLRNTFSDEAIGAFLDTSGEFLEELSLNNVSKVGNNTAMALARRCRNLEKLDLCWCRNLTDEALGLIVDSCSSLKLLKLFGCTQITDVLLDGHSNDVVEIIGVPQTHLLTNVSGPGLEEPPLRYSTHLNE